MNTYNYNISELNLYQIMDEIYISLNKKLYAENEGDVTDGYCDYSSPNLNINFYNDLNPQEQEVLNDLVLNYVYNPNYCQLKNFKINNSNEDPSNINYDIFGFHKYEYIEMTDIERKGELYKIEYYRNLSGDPNNINSYSDLILTENRTYTKDPNTALIVSRNQTTVWYLNDGTTGTTKITTKYYQLKDSIQEEIVRRDNITAFAKLYLLSHIGLANGQILISDLTPYISTYLQGNHQPLLDAVATSERAFMSSTIKATTVSILTF